MISVDDPIRQPVLEAQGLVKRFGRVEALRGANLAVYPGEVVALMGDNGAGKSTLVKIIAGALRPDEGHIFLNGTRADFANPAAARATGVETVYQDLALAPDLDAVSNLFMGREVLMPGLRGRLGVLDKKAMRRQATETLKALSIHLPDNAVHVGSLSGGQRQSVAVGRAATWATKVALMDEPTAALGVVQTQRVQELIRSVCDSGVAVVLITHDLPLAFAVADRIEVLRLGKRVARFRVSTTDSPLDVVAAMTGVVEHPDA